MPVTDLLERNCKLYGNEVALVELNPTMPDYRKDSWKEYSLVQQTSPKPYRREITWSVFDEKANRVANMLLSRGIKRGDRVAILMFNNLEWLPLYFGILKSGAIAVPFNFRFDAKEIQYCADLAEVHIIFFGPEFIGRLGEIQDELSKGRLLIYVGDGCPDYAESYRELVSDCSSKAPLVRIEDEDDAAIYFSSGTTGFPKAILHNHESLLQAAQMEQKHHLTNREDTFLCIPPLYHTGAKFHWMGSLCAGSKAVLLKGTSPEIILDAVSKEHCTIVWLLVPWAQDILAALDSGRIKLEDYKLDQWRLMHIGAQPVPKSLIKRWKEYFPHHLYDTNYGLSVYTGPKFAIDAIAAGKQAAISIHRFVQEHCTLTIGRDPNYYKELDKTDIRIPDYDHVGRQTPPMRTDLEPGSFHQANLPFTEEQVKLETARCLGCGATIVDANQCVGCGVCTTKCMFDAIHLERDLPKASIMRKSEDKLKYILPHGIAQAIKVRFKGKK